MKKRSATLLALVLVLALVAVPNTSVQAASTEGYHTGDGSWAYIQVINEGETGSTFIFHPEGVKAGYITLGKMTGLSYDKKTNTLTMKNFKQPNMTLDINEMGSDFKIKLVGKNEIGSITAWGYGYAGCIELTGSGTLTVNKSKTADAAFTFRAEQSAATLTVGKKVKLYAYAGKESGVSVQVIDSTVSTAAKSFVFNGRKSVKNAEMTTVDLIERVEKSVHLVYEDGYDTYWPESLYTLSKDGKTYWGFAFPGDYGFEYYICKGTGEMNGDTEIVEIDEQITEFEQDPFAEAGYSYKKIGEMYSYTFKGNLTIK